MPFLDFAPGINANLKLIGTYALAPKDALEGLGFDFTKDE